MGTDQRKAIAVVADLLNRGLPALDRVTVLTSRSKLILVNVRMAVVALDSDIGKHHAAMAIGASNVRVQTEERIGRLRIMIEFGDSSDRAPAGCRVAVLAGKVEAAVRAPRPVDLLGRQESTTQHEQDRQAGRRGTDILARHSDRSPTDGGVEPNVRTSTRGATSVLPSSGPLVPAICQGSRGVDD